MNSYDILGYALRETLLICLPCAQSLAEEDGIDLHDPDACDAAGLWPLVADGCNGHDHVCDFCGASIGGDE